MSSKKHLSNAENAVISDEVFSLPFLPLNTAIHFNSCMHFVVNICNNRAYIHR